MPIFIKDDVDDGVVGKVIVFVGVFILLVDKDEKTGERGFLGGGVVWVSCWFVGALTFEMLLKLLLPENNNYLFIYIYIYNQFEL